MIRERERSAVSGLLMLLALSNLLVVLCADREAQPVINTGTIYQ